MAGIRIRIESNAAEISRDLERILGDDKRIQVQALNKAARWARTRTIRELAPRLNVTQKPLRKRISVFAARRGQRPPRASLWIGLKRPITAQEIRGELTSTPSGTVKIGKRVFRGAFVARMPTGHRGIFIRQAGAKHKPRPDGQWTQLPIEEGIVSLWPDAETVGRRFSEKAFAEVYPKEARRLFELRTATRR